MLLITVAYISSSLRKLKFFLLKRDGGLTFTVKLTEKNKQLKEAAPNLWLLTQNLDTRTLKPYHTLAVGVFS